MSKSLFDELLAGMGDAITDIREKVVEEGWFGRTVTDSQANPHEASMREAAAPGVDAASSGISGEVMPPLGETPGNAWQSFVDASRSIDAHDIRQLPEPDIER